MKTILYPAESRGLTKINWLTSRHTFSFGEYYDPKRLGFGALRVINDDIISPSKGFGMHSHQNMEIVSIPVSGRLKHRDNLGNTHVIEDGDIQVMSAGYGISHSEFNASSEEDACFLQIWILPQKRNIEPRYNKRFFSPNQRKNRCQLLISPDGQDQTLTLNQSAYVSLVTLDEGERIPYHCYEQGQGIYIFLISGQIIVANQELEARDGIGISDVDMCFLEAKAESEILIMEVPL